ncbi:MAG: ribosome recycling factor [Spirochaetaceae bacterium]|jgi:ribosome recycling factor|nr:ribosome recycling factor [Spirochaetaceae bacterium]GMO21657.1 MAG: ribosome recycling factor [Termitinemataceae bacterium]
MSTEVIVASEERMKKSIASLKESLSGLRTGRAQAGLFDKIKVNAYGALTPLNQTANVSVPEARLVVIQPWDKTLIGEIEKAIRSSELSLNPANDGKVIRISIPPLTGERRKELVKQAKSQAEQIKVAIRNIRRDGNEELKKLLKEGKITEDDESKDSTELQKKTDSYIEQTQKILEEKEKEIMQN